MNSTSKGHTRAALLCGIVVLTMLLGAVPLTAAGAASSLPAEPFTTEQNAALSAAGVPEGLTGEEWSSMQAMMAAAEYQVTWQTRDGLGAYHAPNREQGFDVSFAPDGFTAAGYAEGEPAWVFGLSLAAYGDTDMPIAVPRENLSADETTVTYRWNERVSEWFHNTPEGVEHGLTLAAPPLGQQGNEIHLAFRLDTDLVPTLSADGQALTLRAPAQGSWQHGPTMLRYDALLVTDAAGRALPAHFQLETSNPSASLRTSLQLVIDATQATYPLTVDPLLYSQTAILYASDAQAGDEFGYAVSISGDTLVIGAYGEDSGGSNAGAVYIFERNTGGADNWGEVTKLMASDALAGVQFGNAVSISGDTLVVGARYEDSGGSNAGAVYVFERNSGGADNWGQVTKLLASDAQANDNLGWAVSISGDTLIVGARMEDSGGTSAGAAYVFERNSGGADNWGQVTKLLASDAQALDQFGQSVSISGDTLVVGAHYEDSGGSSAGAAYVYERNTGGADNWGEVAKLIASDTQGGDYFGTSVSISGDTLVVGARGEDSGGSQAGAAYVYERNTGGADNWGQVTKLITSDAQGADWFGNAVSISGDTLVVAAYGEDSGSSNAGAVYIFERNTDGADNWGQLAKLIASDAEASDYFGYGVSISGDTLVVGAYYEDSGGSNAGAAYVFTGSGDWQEIAKPTASDAQSDDYFGYAVSISGDTLVVGARYEDSGATDAGAAYVFERNQGGSDGWGEVTKLLASDAEAYDYFGAAVSISGDTLIVGAWGEDSGGTYAGAAYVFARNQGGADNWGQVAKLLASDAQAGDQFGISVSISGDTLVVGSYEEDSGGSNAGAAYVFARNQGGSDAWGQVAKLLAADAQAGDRFGWSVSISGDTLVVGAPLENSGGSQAGAAYVFARNQGGSDNWGEVTKLTTSDAEASDYFGHAVSISGDTLVVGAPLENSGGTDAGAAYVFERNTGGADNWGEVTKLLASDAQADDRFGGSVSISGDTLVVGAPEEGSAGAWAGAAYVFERNAGGTDNWGQVVKLTASDAQESDEFGYGVSISGDTLLVGAPYGDSGGADAGAAYVFHRQANYPPVAVDDAYTTTEDTPLVVAAPGVLLNDSDPDGDPLFAFLDSPPANGDLTLDPDGSFVYTPTLNWSGVDTFDYMAADGANPAVAHWPFDDGVNPTADATGNGHPGTLMGGAAFSTTVPISLGAGLSMDLDGVDSYVLAGGDENDFDLNVLSILFWVKVDVFDTAWQAMVTKGDTSWRVHRYQSTGRVSFGTSGLSNGDLPSNSDIDDGQWHHIAAIHDGSTKYLYVDGVLDASIAVSDSISANDYPVMIGENAQQTGRFFDGQIDDMRIYYRALSLPEVQAAMIGDDPPSGSVGWATVSITVTAVNDPPDALDDGYTVVEDSVDNPLDLLSNDSDIENDPLTVFALGTPSAGGSVLNAGSHVTYTPALDFYGSETFTYTISDGNGGFDTATVVVTVTNTNDPPDALDDGYTIPEDSPDNALDLLANDSYLPDPPETLTVSAVGAPDQGGTVLNAGSHVTYTPALDFSGVEVLTYTISDGNGGFDTASVVITVTELGDAPVAVEDAYTTTEDTTLVVAAPGVLENDTDADGDTLTAVLDTGPANGELALASDGGLVYTPTADYCGTDAFTYHAYDGLNPSNVVTVTLDIACINDAPVAAADAYTTTADAALVVAAPGVLSNDTDVEGDTLTAVLDAGPPTGTLLLSADGSFVYTPTLDWSGVVTFSYTANDGMADSDPAIVSIEVLPVGVVEYTIYLPVVFKGYMP